MFLCTLHIWYYLSIWMKSKWPAFITLVSQWWHILVTDKGKIFFFFTSKIAWLECSIAIAGISGLHFADQSSMSNQHIWFQDLQVQRKYFCWFSVVYFYCFLYKLLHIFFWILIWTFTRNKRQWSVHNHIYQLHETSILTSGRKKKSVVNMWELL